MAKYRKRLIVIEAFQFGMTKKSDLPIWVKDAIQRDLIKPFSQYGGSIKWAEIDTFEGTMKAETGDYIIKGVNGNLSICKPDIFHKTYEKVEKHLCNNCIYNFPECKPKKLDFGNGYGNDNVIACSQYKEVTENGE